MKKAILLILFFLAKFNSYSQDSIVKQYDKGKLITEGLYRNDLMEGKWSYWVNDASGYYLKTVENFSQGKRDGNFTEYFSNGKVKTSGSYSKDVIKTKKVKNSSQKGDYSIIEYSVPVGEWSFYNEKGVLIRKEIYSPQGKLLKKEKHKV